jgi:hypothetical protein
MMAEILFELFGGCILLLGLNQWIVLFYSIGYVFIHFVNYGIQINNVHELHHKEVTTNFGLDIYDVMFHTKNPKSEREDTSHFIPTVLLTFGIVAWIQQNYNPTWMYIILSAIVISHIIISVYLWRRYDPVSKTFIGV